MFCRNCGTMLSEGASFCNQCGTPVEQVTEPVQETVQPNTYADQNPTYDYAPPVKKNKKWKKWVIIGSSVAGLALVVGITFIVAGAKLRNFFNSLKSPQEYYRIVEKDNIEGFGDILYHTYDRFVQGANGSVGSSVNLKFEIGDALASMMSMAGSSSGVDLSKIKDIEFNLNGGYSDLSKISLTGEAKINNESIGDFSFFSDILKQESYFGMPSLSSSYLKIAQARTTIGNDSDTDQVQKGMDYVKKITEIIPDGASLKSLVEKYSDVYFDHLNDVTKSSETLTVGGVSQDCTVLTVGIDANTLYDTVLDILNKAKTDEQFKAIYSVFINNLETLTKTRYEDFDITTKSYEERMDDLIEEFNSYKRNAPDLNSKIVMAVYVDGEGMIVGRRITIMNGTEQMQYLIAMPMSGGQFAFTISAGEGMSMEEYVTGSGTCKGNIINGSFSVSGGDFGYDATPGKIEVQNFDLGALKDGEFKGSIVMNMPGANMLSALQLKFDLDTGMSDSDIKLTALYAGSTLGTVTLHANESSYPSNAEPDPSATVYDSSDETAVKNFLAELNIREWLTKISGTIGIDLTSYADQIESYINGPSITNPVNPVDPGLPVDGNWVE